MEGVATAKKGIAEAAARAEAQYEKHAVFEGKAVETPVPDANSPKVWAANSSSLGSDSDYRVASQVDDIIQTIPPDDVGRRNAAAQYLGYNSFDEALVLGELAKARIEYEQAREIQNAERAQERAASALISHARIKAVLEKEGIIDDHWSRDATTTQGQMLQLRFEYAGGIKTRDYVPDTTPFSGRTTAIRNLMIKEVISRNFEGVRFTYVAEYNPILQPFGIAQENTGSQIGPRGFQSMKALYDTIIHEELHHRWWARGISDHHEDSPKKDQLFEYTIYRYLNRRGFPVTKRPRPYYVQPRQLK
jgi:hypothetical protein